MADKDFTIKIGLDGGKEAETTLGKIATQKEAINTSTGTAISLEKQAIKETKELGLANVSLGQALAGAGKSQTQLRLEAQKFYAEGKNLKGLKAELQAIRVGFINGAVSAGKMALAMAPIAAPMALIASAINLIKKGLKDSEEASNTLNKALYPIFKLVNDLAVGLAKGFADFVTKVTSSGVFQFLYNGFADIGEIAKITFENLGLTASNIFQGLGLAVKNVTDTISLNFTKMLQSLAEKASNLPLVGEKFKGMAEELGTAVTAQEQKMAEATANARNSLELNSNKIAENNARLRQMLEQPLPTLEPEVNTSKMEDGLSEVEGAVDNHSKNIGDKAKSFAQNMVNTINDGVSKAILDSLAEQARQMEATFAKETKLLKKEFEARIEAQKAYFDEVNRLNEEATAKNEEEFARGELSAYEYLQAKLALEEEDRATREQQKLEEEALQAEQAQAEAELEKQQNAERNKMAEKQFNAEKATKISSALIATGLGAISAFSAMSGIPIVGPILGGVAAATVAAFGAIQVASIARQKFIPAFEKGGIAPGGLALVGEAGPELVNLPAGARVYNNGDTIDILNNLGQNGNSTVTNNINTINIQNTEQQSVDSILTGLSARSALQRGRNG